MSSIYEKGHVMATNAPQWTGDDNIFVDGLFAWYQRVGASHYDEQVTQLGHALQTAHHARQDGASEAEIVAALLHDVGHFLADEHQHRGDFLSRDLRHEEMGARWLVPYFSPVVTEPVRLHVPAKRWLCTVDAAYWQALSDASKHSLELQGGKMMPDEQMAFEAQDGWQTAVTLRKRDDRGKQPGLLVPGLESYRDVVLQMLTTSA